MAAKARALIEELALQPHPEGGWYAETWRTPAPAGARASSTAIHFLLEKGQSSHWHRVDATEVWLWHSGDPLALAIAENDDGPINEIRLGHDILSGDRVQAVVPPNAWQAARPLEGDHGYVLVSCVVAPGFEFDRFELAEPGWSPG